MVKPSRARTQSATASVSTGFSKLKIGAPAAPAIRLSRPTTTVDTTLPSKPSTQSLRNRDDRANELEILHERSLDGLGLKTDAGQDWTADEMYGEAEMHLDQPTSHKRDHVEVLSSENGEEDEGNAIGSKVRIIEGEFDDPEDWIAANGLAEVREKGRILHGVADDFEEHLDYYDTTMVAEYSEEIFAYMSQLEVSRSFRFLSATILTLCSQDQAMPNPRYMDHQTEIEWCVVSSFHVSRPELTKMNLQADANHVDRLATSSSYAISHAPGNALDRHQHCRPFPVESSCQSRQVSISRSYRYVCGCEIRGDHGSEVSLLFALASEMDS